MRTLSVIIFYLLLTVPCLCQNSWQKYMEVFKDCENPDISETIVTIFDLEKSILISDIELIKKTIQENLAQCRSETADSLIKEITLEIFTNEFGFLPHGQIKKLELTNTLLNRYLQRESHLTNRDSSHLITLHLYLGNCYSSMGYKEKALNTYAKALIYSNQASSISDLRNIVSVRYAQLKQNIGHRPSPNNIDEYRSLKIDFAKIYKPNTKLGLYFSKILDLNAAMHFTNFSQQDSAQHYLNKVPENLDLFDMKNARDASLSVYYKKFELWDEYEKVLKSRIKQALLDQGTSSHEENLLGMHYLKQKQYEAAKHSLVSARNQSIKTVGDLKLIQDELAYIQSILGLAELEIIQENNDLGLEFIQKARDLLLEKLTYSEFQKDKIKLLEMYAEIVRLIFAYNSELNLSDNTLFQFIEESKSLALFDEIKQNSILKNDLGKEKYSRYKALQDSALSTKIKLKQLNLTTAERIRLEQEKASFVDSITSLRKLSSFRNFTDQNIETLISQYPNTSILQYYISENAATLMLVNQSKMFAQQFDLSDSIQNTIKAFNQGIRNYKFEIKTLDSLSSIVYETFILPVAQELQENLLIIPHGITSSIPFEALKSPEGKYLVEEHNISYAFSLNVNSEMIKKGSKNTQFLGFAPSYNSTIEGFKLSPLSENIAELADVSEAFSSKKMFKHKSAEKSKFKAYAKNADVIHISAHADIHPTDNDFSYIAFSDATSVKDSTFLYLSELYNMDLNTEMIVLSACNTSVGTYKDGEGILSLARGFAYAGASSIVSSLWKVNEISTREIVSDFYELLSEGKNKANALAIAKRRYLKDNSGRNRHPYYWSGIVVLGDTEALNFSSGNLPYLILLLIPIYFFFLRKRS